MLKEKKFMEDYKLTDSKSKMFRENLFKNVQRGLSIIPSFIVDTNWSFFDTMHFYQANLAAMFEFHKVMKVFISNDAAYLRLYKAVSRGPSYLMLPAPNPWSKMIFGVPSHKK